MMLAMACFTSFITILVFISFREKPGVPLFSCKPNSTQTNNILESEVSEVKTQTTAEEIGLWKQLKICAGNVDFVLTGIGTSGVLGLPFSSICG